ncbi:MAG: hypothetical protein D6732_18750 [Methanobacteriota archaeon]|nr:MAG: hypothetical protein D6732_18750 [Euryarchaeota archaeon]
MIISIWILFVAFTNFSILFSESLKKFYHPLFSYFFLSTMVVTTYMSYGYDTYYVATVIPILASFQLVYFLYDFHIHTFCLGTVDFLTIYKKVQIMGILLFFLYGFIPLISMGAFPDFSLISSLFLLRLLLYVEIYTLIHVHVFVRFVAAPNDKRKKAIEGASFMTTISTVLFVMIVMIPDIVLPWVVPFSNFLIQLLSSIAILSCLYLLLIRRLKDRKTEFPVSTLKYLDELARNAPDSEPGREAQLISLQELWKGHTYFVFAKARFYPEFTLKQNLELLIPRGSNQKAIIGEVCRKFPNRQKQKVKEVDLWTLEAIELELIRQLHPDHLVVFDHSRFQWELKGDMDRLCNYAEKVYFVTNKTEFAWSASDQFLALE